MELQFGPLQMLVWALTAYLVVMALSRLFALLGEIRKPRFFTKMANRKQHAETLRIENVTAGKILNLLKQHRNKLDVLGVEPAVESCRDVVSLIQKKYPGAFK